MNRIVPLRLVLAGAGAVLLAGCVDAQQQARREATRHWNQVRAEMKAQLAADHLDAGNVRQAAGEMNEAVRLHPEAAALAPLRARVLLAEGKVAEAAELLERTHLDGTAQARVAYLLGIVRQQQQRWEEALAAFRQAATLDPGEVAYPVAAAQAALQLGRAADALAELQAQAPGFGWTAEFQAALAECHEQLESWGPAADVWQAIAPATGTGADLRERLAAALCRAGRYAEAAPVLAKLLEEDPEADHLRLALAASYLEQGRAAAAREQAQRLLQRRPEHPAALRLLARALILEGQEPAALRVARQALAAQPEDAGTLALVGTLAWRTGAAEQAAEIAARLLARDPQDELGRALAERVGVRAE